MQCYLHYTREFHFWSHLISLEYKKCEGPFPLIQNQYEHCGILWKAKLHNQPEPPEASIPCREKFSRFHPMSRKIFSFTACSPNLSAWFASPSRDVIPLKPAVHWAPVYLSCPLRRVLVMIRQKAGPLALSHLASQMWKQESDLGALLLCKPLN